MKGISVTQYGGIEVSRNPSFDQVFRDHAMQEKNGSREIHGPLVPHTNGGPGTPMSHTSQKETRVIGASDRNSGSKNFFCRNSPVKNYPAPQQFNESRDVGFKNNNTPMRIESRPLDGTKIYPGNVLPPKPCNSNNNLHSYGSSYRRGRSYSCSGGHKPYQQYKPQQHGSGQQLIQYYNSTSERRPSEESQFMANKQNCPAYQQVKTPSLDSCRDEIPVISLDPCIRYNNGRNSTTSIPNTGNSTPSNMTPPHPQTIEQEESFPDSVGNGMIQLEPFKREYNSRNGMNSNSVFPQMVNSISASSLSYSVEDGHMYSISQPKWRTSLTGQPIERGKFKAGDIIRRTSFCPHILCDFGGSLGVAMDGDTMCIDYVTDDLVYHLVGGDCPVPDCIDMDGLFVKVGERRS